MGQLLAIALGFPAVLFYYGYTYAGRVASSPPRGDLDRRRELLGYLCFGFAGIMSTLLLCAIGAILIFMLGMIFSHSML